LVKYTRRPSRLISTICGPPRSRVSGADGCGVSLAIPPNCTDPVSRGFSNRDVAAQYYEDAEDWGRRARLGENEMPARLVQAWAQLNRAMLELDRGQIEAAREYLGSSLAAFERASEHGALLTCVAAGACYAEACGEHVTALALIGSLTGEGTRRLSPTYWHRWVVRALKSSRRAINDHHVATEAELMGESWTLPHSLREARRLIAAPAVVPAGQ
jgi:hypothetical protein